MELVLPMNYVELEQEEMMYLDGGALTTSDKAWIIGICVVSAIAIGAAVWFGAWGLAAWYFGYAFKAIILKAGAAAVVSTLIGALALGSAAAWNIVNFALK